MPGEVEGVPEEALKAAAAAWEVAVQKRPQRRSVLDEILGAAAPSIRSQERQRVRKELQEAVARTSVAPSGIVFSDDYDRGRTEERRTWLAALDSLEDDDGQG